MSTTDSRPRRVTARVALRALAAVAVIGQLVVLYAPSTPAVTPFPNSDKVVHVLVFFVPVALALLAGLPARLVVSLFAAHAVVSELVQHFLLPGRSGDPRDVVADLAGVCLGVLVWRLVHRFVRAGDPGVVGRMPRRW